MSPALELNGIVPDRSGGIRAGIPASTGARVAVDSRRSFVRLAGAPMRTGSAWLVSREVCSLSLVSDVEEVRSEHARLRPLRPWAERRVTRH